MTDDMKRLWYKKIANSFYYPIGSDSNTFYFCDPNIAKEITEEGRKLLKELENTYGTDYNFG